MTDKLLKDVRWILKNSLCLLWAACPCFGWFGFVFMAKKSGRQQFRTIGLFYGIVSLTALLLSTASPMLQYLAWSINRSVSTLSALAGQLYDIGIFAFVIGWIVCLLHTAICARQYYQYLALKRAAGPKPHPLMRDFFWKLKQQLWLVWCFFPWVGGLSLYFAGYRMGSRHLKRWGLISLGGSLGFAGFVTVASLFSYTWSNYGGDLLLAVSISFVMLTLLAAFLVREDYLEFRARQWDADLDALPQLRKGGWRRSNSLWQLWNLTPYLGGIGILLAGRRGRSRRISRMGFAFMILGVLALLLPLVLSTEYGGLGYYLPFKARELVNMVTDWLLPGLWVWGLFYSTLIRWEVLTGRARSLMGYESEFQRDADMLSRFRRAEEARELAAEEAREQAAQGRTPRQPAEEQELSDRLDLGTPVTQTVSEGLVDINRCTQAELMGLPGMGIVQAKEAMAYRQEHGGFASVDEFIQVLGIKPHFAVQILKLAAVSAPAKPRGPEVRSSIGRRLDF